MLKKNILLNWIKIVIEEQIIFMLDQVLLQSKEAKLMFIQSLLFEKKKDFYTSSIC